MKVLGQDQVSILVWTDDSEKVVVYLFENKDDGYVSWGTFVSDRLTKQDVSGKETGVWER